MSDIVKVCRHWAEQMHNAASAIESVGDGSPVAMQVIDNNRAVATTLESAAAEIEMLRSAAASAAASLKSYFDQSRTEPTPPTALRVALAVLQQAVKP